MTAKPKSDWLAVREFKRLSLNQKWTIALEFFAMCAGAVLLVNREWGGAFACYACANCYRIRRKLDA